MGGRGIRLKWVRVKIVWVGISTLLVRERYVFLQNAWDVVFI